MKTLNRASWILVLLLLFIAPNYAIGQQKLSWQQAFGFDRGPASFLRVSHPTWQIRPYQDTVTTSTSMSGKVCLIWLLRKPHSPRIRPAGCG